MINKSCPLSDKDKLRATLHGVCLQNTFGFDHCKNCPYFSTNKFFGVQPMEGPIGSMFKFKLHKNRKIK